ncbi:hypothetical protein EV361DRAFT_1000050 [Lentinula raphanica]|nr:hypothetical protein EV360DRAFT_86507 [Lentinula raphanica]KAJ3969274.1 hypothetical protein EV361DRAFT_1000050 [Lentinula raphanica]
MFVRRVGQLIIVLALLSSAFTSPIAIVKQQSDPSNAANNTMDPFHNATLDENFNSSAITAEQTSDLGKRAPMTLFLVGCTSILNKSLRNPSAARRAGPFHLSPEGGLYLTHRLENAEAMARMEYTNCVPTTVNGFASKFMVATYEFDSTGLTVMDLDTLHWLQHDGGGGHQAQNLPTWWNVQSLQVIPYSGVNPQNQEMYNKYLSSHVIIGTLTPASHYGPGLTDLWSLWVLKTVRNDPKRIDPVSRLTLVKVNHYFT